MAEGPTRRACNRCHAQKLSCKRNGDQPCERCVRLKTECKSSLSLRFRRNRLLLEKSPQREHGSSKGRRTVAVAPACTASEFDGDSAPRGGFGQGQGHGQPPPAGMPVVAFAGAGAMLDTVVGFPYSPLQDHLFTAEPSTATFLRTIPRGVSDQDLTSLETPWSPSYQASGPCADWTQSPSASSYGSSPPNYQYTSSSFSCLDPQQLRFKEQTELFGTKREQAQQVQQRVPRRILLRPSTTNTMAAQGEWLAELSDISASLWNLSSLVPYFVESGEDADVYACQSPNQSSESSKGGDSGEQGFPIQAMFEASGRLVRVLGDITGPEGADARRVELDPGTSLLVLSTYVRLLDLYHKVFRLVHSEATVLGPCPRSTFQLCKLPNVSVGSFPVASSQSLQMSLTIRLAEEFLCNLRAAVASFSERLPDAAARSQHGGGQGALWSAVDVSFSAVREREQDICRNLGETRSHLELSSTS